MVHRLSPRHDEVTRVSLYRYLLPLRSSAEEPATARTTERAGLLIRLVDKNGLVGWGEAAPLPGFSRESVDDVVIEARGWAAGSRDAGSPSLAFAIDLASDELERRRAPQSAPGNRSQIVRVNALIDDAGPDEQEVTGKLEAGFRCFKMKVGRRPISEDVARVRRLRTLLSDEIELRLDANRAWSYDEAARFCERTADLDIDYIEEPTKRSEDLPELARVTPVPIALDETTRSVQPEELESFGFAAALILKPSLLGGMDLYQRWLAAARAHDIRVILTGSYESGVATRHVIGLAAAREPDLAHGLSTYGYLREDVLTERLPVFGSSIDFREVEHAGTEVDLSRIEHLETI